MAFLEEIGQLNVIGDGIVQGDVATVGIEDANDVLTYRLEGGGQVLYAAEGPG